MKSKTAAIVTIFNAPQMSKRGRNQIAAWLERQASLLRKNAKQLTNGRFTARYIFAPMAALVLMATGCANPPTPQSLETKAFAITRVVVRQVLENNPGNEKLREGLRVASADLKIISTSETFDLITLLSIVNRLPPGSLGDDDKAFYIETGLLFFSDEIGTVSVDNPELGRAAAKGMARAIDSMLALGM